MKKKTELYLKKIIKEEAKKLLNEKWNYKIIVTKPWNDLSNAMDEKDEKLIKKALENLVKSIRNQIKRFKNIDEDEMGSLTDTLDNIKTLNFDPEDLGDSFNYLWNEVYNWADYNNVWLQTQ